MTSRGISKEELQRLVEIHAPTFKKEFKIFYQTFISEPHPDLIRLIHIIHGAAHIIWEVNPLVSEELRALRSELSELSIRDSYED